MPPFSPPISDAVRRIRVPAYLIAGLMFFIPLVEIAVAASPYRLHDPSWRVGLISAAANTSTSILVALLLAYLVGVFAGDRLTIWLIAIASAVMVLLCVGASGAFTLDALQIRAQVRPDLEGRYGLTSGWALAKIFLAALGGAVLSVNAFRNGRSLQRALERRGKKTAAVLVTSSAPIAPPITAPIAAPIAAPLASGPASSPAGSPIPSGPSS